MPKKKVTIKAEGYFELEYNPESKEFQETLESYRASINKSGDEKDVLISVVHHFVLGGSCESMVEGVGFVQKKGRDKPTKLFSGITVVDDEPQFDYEIQ